MFNRDREAVKVNLRDLEQSSIRQSCKEMNTIGVYSLPWWVMRYQGSGIFTFTPALPPKSPSSLTIFPQVTRVLATHNNPD